MFRKVLVAALLVVLPATVRAQSAYPDMRDYQSLLDRYVVRVNAKGAPLDTRFEYEQLFVDEKIWTEKSSALLAGLHGELTSAKPSLMTPSERLAWGINTYNFLVIERVTLNLLRPGHKFQRYKSVDQISAGGSRFFEGYAAEIEGRQYTLPAFERRFVYGDTTPVGSPHAVLHDPRVLFAINPGRVGAPPLQPRAFGPDSLDRQLDRATRGAIALKRFVEIRTTPPLLLVSDWLGNNRADLGGTEAGMLEFVKKYAPLSVRANLLKLKLTAVSRYFVVDPLLNQKDHPKVVMPSTPSGGDTVAP